MTKVIISTILTFVLATTFISAQSTITRSQLIPVDEIAAISNLDEVLSTENFSKKDSDWSSDIMVNITVKTEDLPRKIVLALAESGMYDLKFSIANAEIELATSKQTRILKYHGEEHEISLEYELFIPNKLEGVIMTASVNK